MKVSVFHKDFAPDSGKFLIYGNEQTKKIADLIADGHLRVEAQHGPEVMWDYVQNTVVPDPDWVAKQQGKQQAAQDWEDMQTFFQNTTTVKSGPNLDADAVEAMFQALKGHFG